MSLDKILLCTMCNKIFDMPVVTQCETLCKRHLNGILSKDQKTIKCPVCHERHPVPEAGFRPDSAMEALLKIHSSEKKELKLPLEEMKKLINYPAIYIHDYIQQIRMDIEKKIEEEFKVLNDRKEVMFNKLAQFDLECKLFKNLNSPFQDFELELEKTYDAEHTDVLLLDYTFSPLLTILSKDMAQTLIGLLGFSSQHILKLMYQGSTHGFDSSDFHSRCDGIPYTLTIIKSTSSYIFGGYTEVEWDSSGQYKNDPNAFIYSLSNKDHKPVIMRSNGDGYSIYCHSGYGPTFGHSDLEICKNANSNINSCSNLGYSYTSDLVHGSNEATTFLAGSYNFQISDIAVYQKI